MSSNLTSEFIHSGFFVLRSPLLPFSHLTGLSRERLASILEEPDIQNALAAASSSLQSGIDTWKQNPSSKKGVQAERAAVRYLFRMAARCTPFGLFAGCSLGHIGEPTALELSGRAEYRVSCRLDFDYRRTLASKVNSEDLTYFPNSSLRRAGKYWHYIQGLHRLVKLEADCYLDAVLSAASPAAPFAALVDCLCNLEPRLTRAQAGTYLGELVSEDILQSDLLPLVTGPGAADLRVTKLCDVPKLSAIAAELPASPGKPEPSRLFHLDLIKPARKLKLPLAVIDELLVGVDALCCIVPPSTNGPLGPFKDAFLSRYDRAWVPLAEALDPESGIGFGDSGRDSSPLLRGMRFPAPQVPPETDPGSILLQKLLHRLQPPPFEIELTPEDLPAVQTQAATLPDSFAVLATLIASSASAIDSGDFRVLLKTLAGPGAARTFARFAHADPDLAAALSAHLRAEEALHPGAVFAEIVYAPSDRMGNIVARPVLRDYEVVYLGRSGAPLERQIPVSDLLIGISEDRIVVYSKRLGKEILPRLTAAHGFDNPKLPAIYRFLCEVQQQDVTLPIFAWGAAATNLDYLPRLRIGRVILSPARWRLTHDDIQRLSVSTLPGFRRDRNLPRWIVFEQADQNLLVDLENPLSIDAFIHSLRRSESATATEFLPGLDALCLEAPEGRFTHELHVPFIRRTSARQSELLVAPRVCARAARSFAPGSEWLYVKLYGGPSSADDALAALRNIVHSFAVPWFFIRYRDAEHHLRIRFHGDSTALTPALHRVWAPLLESGAIHKVQFDTYEREIERYGGLDGLALSEQLFYADSDAVLDILPYLEDEKGLDQRWRAALCGIHLLLDDFGFDLPGRHAAARKLRDTYFAEFHIDTQMRHAIGDRFRELYPDIECPSDSVKAAFGRRSARIRPIVSALRDLSAASRLSVSVEDLVLSYMHMHVNRMLRADWREHEVVLYDFLFRLYTAQLARARNQR